MPLKSGKLSAAEKQKRYGFIKGQPSSVIPKELENDPVFFTKNIVRFYLELKQKGMLGVASRMIWTMKNLISGGMSKNPKSVLIVGSGNVGGETPIGSDWYLTYSFELEKFIFSMEKSYESIRLLTDILRIDEELLDKFVNKRTGEYTIPITSPQSAAEFIKRVETSVKKYHKQNFKVTRTHIDNRVEDALQKLNVKSMALQSGNMNENFWRVTFDDDSIVPLNIKTLWLPTINMLNLTFFPNVTGTYMDKFNKLFTQQDRILALPLNKVSKYITWFVNAYENSIKELNEPEEQMKTEESIKKFIKSIFLIEQSTGIPEDKLEKFKDKFLVLVADDSDKKARIIKELEQLRDGTVKPGSKLEAAKNKQYSMWSSENFQAIIDHLNTRALPEEATDTIAEIILDLAMMHPDSASTKALFHALETKDFSSQSEIYKVIVQNMPPEWKKDDYIDVVRKLVQKSEQED